DGTTNDRKSWGFAAVTEYGERFFETLHFRVGLAGGIPEVRIAEFFAGCFARAHNFSADVPLLPPRFRACRNCCIPRCKLTRTEPCVSPVRAAISGPVIPSTRRRISGSR